MDQDEDRNTGMILLVGALLGAGITLLLAPKAGSELRQSLRDRAQRAWKFAWDSQESLRERVEELLDKIAEQSEMLVQKADSLTQEQKEKIKDGIAVAREELDRLRERISRLDY